MAKGNIVCAYSNKNSSKVKQLIEPVIISRHEIRLDLDDLEMITVSEEILLKNLSNSTLSSFSCWLNQSYSTLIVEDKEGALEFEEVTIDEGMIQHTLKNHEHQMCSHSVEGLEICWSYILQPEKEKVLLCAGRPCKNDFIELAPQY
ncbi:MAG: hypothetical protein ACTSQ4_12445 [Candidatus Heimdallarchaeaceae archaeon]